MLEINRICLKSEDKIGYSPEGKFWKEFFVK
jgi:hypothetical protein